MKERYEIKKAVDRLDAGEAKSCLGLMLQHIRLLKEPGQSSEEAAAGLIALYDQLVKRDAVRPAFDPDPDCTRVHIVTGDSFAGSMKRALRELGWADTHKLVTIRDHYAIGPIADLDSPEGLRARSEWFKHNIADAALAFCDDVEDEYREWLDKLHRIPEQAEIIIWAGQSATEQTGLRHALHLLRQKPNTIRVCDACTLHDELFNRTNASVTCRRSGEIAPDKLREMLSRMDARGGCNALSASDIKRLSGEWRALAEQGGVLRIWRDGAVQEVPADYFDLYLLATLDRLTPSADAGGFMKSARVIGEAVGHCEQDIGDEYFEYRLRELLYTGVLEVKGVPAGMRYYSVRRKRQAGN